MKNNVINQDTSRINPQAKNPILIFGDGTTGQVLLEKSLGIGEDGEEMIGMVIKPDANIKFFNKLSDSEINKVLLVRKYKKSDRLILNSDPSFQSWLMLVNFNGEPTQISETRFVANARNTESNLLQIIAANKKEIAKLRIAIKKMSEEYINIDEMAQNIIEGVTTGLSRMFMKKSLFDDEGGGK